ncbi:hypothetical protein TNCV_4767941 [Trichonephila clavipes]|nr:hypothetical protein TNCV_4767941 [Trichonephila clavipes]
MQSIECLLSQCYRPITAGPLSSHQDIPAETEEMNNLAPVATPPCHDPTTNQDTLIQACPSTSGHIKGWRNVTSSVVVDQQREPFPDLQKKQ